MTIAAVTLSHSPLLDFIDPPTEVKQSVDEAFRQARSFVEEFDPDLVINFAPDHYNGFFYDILPPFCIGYEATSIGDFGSQAGKLDVDTEISERLAKFALDRDLDLAVSLAMQVDHGAVQPLEILFSDIAAKPVVPVFINSVAPPFAPMRRIRKLGEVVGAFVAEELRDRKVLVVGSGGLSHEPPVPEIATAAGAVRANLLGAGRNLDADARAARQERVIAAARAFASGAPGTKPLAPEWDRHFMRLLADGDFGEIDTWTPDWMTEVAGNSSHEVRTWVAAYAAMDAHGSYQVDYSYYRPIPEYIAGFGVTTVAAQ